jgi:phosphoglycerate dehydrogenase-like enzyme
MESLNILVATPSMGGSLPLHADEVLRRIRAVSPRIRVENCSELVGAELSGDRSSKGKLDALLAGAEVLFGLVPPPNITTRAPNLRWFQATSAGVDRLRDTEIWRSPVTITGVSGIHATPIGEFVLGMMLMFAKNMPQSFQMKKERHWQRYVPQTLRGKTVGIVGLGHIGREVARLAKAFGMRVIATRRSAKQAGKARNVDLLLPRRSIRQMLTESDYVTLCVPLTPETEHLIGEAELRAMKPASYIINIGRGGLIDEEALLRALDGAHIAGAGLDVTAVEPLPAESRLWDFKNVILTPHIAGGREDYMLQAVDLFCDNLGRYLAGRKLRNLVSRKKGY